MYNVCETNDDMPHKTKQDSFAPLIYIYFPFPLFQEIQATFWQAFRDSQRA